MEGWISLHRKLIESEIWEKPPLYMKVWVYFLLSAQHSDYKGLKAGQLRTSIPDIIEACKWKVGARTERPTKDQIYQIIEWMRKTKRNPDEGGNESNAKATMITTTKATHGMLINIDNYGIYQHSEERESNDESNDETATKPPRKQRQSDNINNNGNNGNNDDKEKPSSPKNAKRVYSEDDRYYKMALRFKELQRENMEELGLTHLTEKSDMQKWADSFRLMIERDKYPESEIAEVVNFVNHDNFEMTVVLSPMKMRKRYKDLIVKARSSNSKPAATGFKSKVDKDAEQRERMKMKAMGGLTNGRTEVSGGFAPNQNGVPLLRSE